MPIDRRSVPDRRAGPARAAGARTLAIACLSAVLLAGCAHQPIGFPYPREALVYPETGARLPRVLVLPVEDARPPEQHEGRGHFLDVTFPDDESWQRPVTEMYREALLQDIGQTQLAEPVPLSGQADYTLAATVHSWQCRMHRNGMSYALPVAAGMLVGFIWGNDTSSSLKRGAALSVLACGMLPVPLHVRAEAEVELVLTDRTGKVVWRQDCIGDIEDDVGEPAASRRDAHYAEKMIPQAVKRCNACLLGQLRQFLVEHRTP